MRKQELSVEEEINRSTRNRNTLKPLNFVELWKQNWEILPYICALTTRPQSLPAKRFFLPYYTGEIAEIWLLSPTQVKLTNVYPVFVFSEEEASDYRKRKWNLLPSACRSTPVSQPSKTKLNNRKWQWDQSHLHTGLFRSHFRGMKWTD